MENELNNISSLNCLRQDFEQWATAQRKNSLEWSDEYPRWVEVYELLKRLLPIEETHDLIVDDLLFFIGKDVEETIPAKLLSEHPDFAVYVGKFALTSSDIDGRREIVNCLWKVASKGDREDARAIIWTLVSDPDPQVRQTALFCGLHLDCGRAVEIAVKWTDSEIGSDRAHAIRVLREGRSELWKSAVEKLRNDSDPAVLHQLSFPFSG